MCLRPITIKNPLYLRSSYATEGGEIVKVPKNLSPADEYITVPCGKCADCRTVYFNSLLQRGLVESMSSYLYFVTLTYDNKHIPSMRLPNGQEIFFSEYLDIQNMFKRFRDAKVLDRDFRYICVNEYGDKSSRPHFHLLIFVGKRESDNSITPLFIEDVLRKNLGKYFAINLGTRKNPRYEPLFTFSYKQTPFGLRTNYFVQYVDPGTKYEYMSQDKETTYVKTLRYLIGYVNKGSAFESTIEKFLEDYKDDISLCSRLRYILRSRVRYSKGFGCGFVDGYKHYIPRISVRSSFVTLYQKFIHDSLPAEYSSFAELYPHQADMLSAWIGADRYKRFTTYQDFTDSLSVDEAYLHSLVLNYFPRYFSKIYNDYYRDHALSNPKISYFFDRRPYIYYQQKIKSHSFEENYASPVFKLIRSFVEEGISKGVPFLAFKMSSSQTYTALCKFYRERCCTLYDIQRMFESIGVSNYEQWQQKVEHSNDLRKANIVNSNKISHFSESLDLQYQKNCLSLSRNYVADDFYRYLYYRFK